MGVLERFGRSPFRAADARGFGVTGKAVPLDFPGWGFGSSGDQTTASSAVLPASRACSSMRATIARARFRSIRLGSQEM
jgi:hypothetical protein